MAVTLTGTLEGFGLVSIFGLLQDTGKTGCLRFSSAEWTAELAFDRGEAVAASFGDASGLAALEALALALPRARYTFVEGRELPGERNLASTPAALRLFLEQLAELRRSAGLPESLLEAVPEWVEPASEPQSAPALAVDWTGVRTLALVDGRRTVEEIVAARGTAAAIADVSALAEQGLLRFGQPPRRLPRQARSEVRYWARTALLAGLVTVLLGLNLWQARLVPTVPVGPTAPIVRADAIAPSPSSPPPPARVAR